MTWDDAKVNCENDNAMLACFGTQDERDHVTNICNECWVGYKWQNGGYLFTYFNIIDILPPSSEPFSDLWQSIASLDGTSCPNNVVPGSGQGILGTICGSLKNDSPNKLTSSTCDSWTNTGKSLCQKPK